MKRRLTLLSIIIFTSYSIYGQICGTTSIGAISYSRKTATNTSFLNSSNPIRVNVYYHIVRENSGTSGFDSNSLDNVTGKLNTAFNQHNLYFNKLGFDYINNSTYYNIDDTNSNREFDALVQINNRPDAINIYIIKNAVRYAGRADGFLSQALVIEKNYANTQIVSHEVGHCLNLYHTFHGSPRERTPGSCPEDIISSSPNCDDCGDEVCDTPADADRRNEEGYNPDLTNIMSYYDNLDHFTNGQAERIRIAFASSSLLQRVVVAGSSITELVGVPTICNTPNYAYTLKNYSSSNSTSWSVSSNIRIINKNNTSITIRAINSSVNGIATITAANTIGTIAKKDIWIGKPKIEISLRPLVNYVYIDLVGANNTDISKQIITSTTWERVSGGGGCYANLSSGLAQGNCLNWTVRAKITATNSCGATILYRDITPPLPTPCDTLTFNGESFIILNPCDDSETSSSFTTNNNNNNIKRVVIYDITGRVMREFLSGNINISNLSSGIYIAKIELTSGKILTKKIIK